MLVDISQHSQNFAWKAIPVQIGSISEARQSLFDNPEPIFEIATKRGPDVHSFL
jgi:hypothetical protein